MRTGASIHSNFTEGHIEACSRLLDDDITTRWCVGVGATRNNGIRVRCDVADVIRTLRVRE